MKKILNLGCGKTYIAGAENVDFGETKTCDRVLDLSSFPYPYEDNSIDEIYMLHLVEHFYYKDVVSLLKECHRILKNNGLLHIQCPHFTSMMALTPIDHVSVFGWVSMDFLMGHNYIIKKPLFNVEYKRIDYLMKLHHKNNFVPFDSVKTEVNKGEHNILRMFFSPLIFFVQSLINFNPILFERVWCYYVGGADEVTYRLRKSV